MDYYRKKAKYEEVNKHIGIKDHEKAFDPVNWYL